MKADASQLIAFLQQYHDDVMGCEAKAIAALEKGDSESYRSWMKQKAEKMSLILKAATPYFADFPEDEKDPIYHQLHRFSNSANMGLHLNSPFYWSALLWNDDAKPGDPDNLQRFIRLLEKGFACLLS